MKIKSGHFKKEYDLQKAELIGEGNFAQVFRIFDNDLHDSIAIRKVKKSQADMEDIVKEKLINEELKKVENQNILKIYDIIDQQEAVWYITQYCSGGSLWDALNLCKDNKMPEKEALQCILQISKGVQELHNHRITHRDLKPQNILLKSKYVIGKPLPVIKLADFGLSTQKIIMQTIAGTKQYIAPEQAKFHNYTNAVDVWSLGIIFDQILHGNPFYSGEDNKEVFNKILKMPFRIRDQAIRPSIKDLLISLLKKKPYERPIIAVIRSTVEKILEEIQGQKTEKLEVHSERNKKSKSSNQSKHSIEKLNSTNRQSKQNILAVSRKIYESGPVQREEGQRLQKTWKSNFVNDSATPTSKHKPNIKEDILKNQSSAPKIETKPNAYRDKISRNKSIVDEIIQPKVEKQDAKNDKKEQIKQSRENDKNVKAQNAAVKNIGPIHQKISLYKIDRKKMIASNIRKQEQKQEVIDLNSYKNRVFGRKKELLELTLKNDKNISFLPNTQLSPNEFQNLGKNTEEAICQLKKKMSFLNYFSTSEDFEIKLLRGSYQLQRLKNKCEQEFELCNASLKEAFLQQIDMYVDQYLQKALK